MLDTFPEHFWSKERKFLFRAGVISQKRRTLRSFRRVQVESPLR